MFNDNIIKDFKWYKDVGIYMEAQYTQIGNALNDINIPQFHEQLMLKVFDWKDVKRLVIMTLILGEYSIRIDNMDTELVSNINMFYDNSYNTYDYDYVQPTILLQYMVQVNTTIQRITKLVNACKEHAQIVQLRKAYNVDIISEWD